MAEQTEPKEVVEEKPTPMPEQIHELTGRAQPSNADIKNSDLFQSLAQELKTLRDEKAQREEQENAAAKKAEAEKLEAEGNYKAALELKEKELADQKATFEKQILERDLKAALLRNGATNETFLNGAVAGYDVESSIDEYVSSLKSNEANAPFFGDVKSPPPDAPGAIPVNGGRVNWEQVKQWENGEDREKRAEARKLIGDYRRNHGKYPY